MNERIYFLDAMRGILMMLGVVLHSAQVFNPEKTWVIFSEQSSGMSYLLIQIIHVFRMPAFFIVSGYFCLLTIKRYGGHKFLHVRIQRIIVPLIITAITLNTLQTIILASTDWKNFYLPQYIIEGEWVSHLWFLVNLVIYFLTAFICALFFKRQISWLNSVANMLVSRIPFFVLLLILPLSWILIKISAKFGLPLYADILGVIDMHDILFYLPYFIFGVWLRENPDQLFRFSRISPFISIAIIIIAILISSLLDASTSIAQAILLQYFGVLIIWYSTSLCFHIFMKFTNTHSPVFMFLSDASYTVYLFHHIFVISIGLILIATGIGGTTGLMALITLTTLVTFFIHKFIVSEYPLLRYMYNGK